METAGAAICRIIRVLPTPGAHSQRQRVPVARISPCRAPRPRPLGSQAPVSSADEREGGTACPNAPAGMGLRRAIRPFLTARALRCRSLLEPIRESPAQPKTLGVSSSRAHHVVSSRSLYEEEPQRPLTLTSANVGPGPRSLPLSCPTTPGRPRDRWNRALH